jgi:hypothetical protein
MHSGAFPEVRWSKEPLPAAFERNSQPFVGSHGHTDVAVEETQVGV